MQRQRSQSAESLSSTLWKDLARLAVIVLSGWAVLQVCFGHYPSVWTQAPTILVPAEVTLQRTVQLKVYWNPATRTFQWTDDGASMPVAQCSVDIKSVLDQSAASAPTSSQVTVSPRMPADAEMPDVQAWARAGALKEAERVIREAESLLPTRQSSVQVGDFVMHPYTGPQSLEQWLLNEMGRYAYLVIAVIACVWLGLVYALRPRSPAYLLRTARGQCTRCGYRLQSERCSECGERRTTSL